MFFSTSLPATKHGREATAVVRVRAGRPCVVRAAGGRTDGAEQCRVELLHRRGRNIFHRLITPLPRLLSRIHFAAEKKLCVYLTCKKKKKKNCRTTKYEKYCLVCFAVKKVLYKNIYFSSLSSSSSKIHGVIVHNYTFFCII